MANGELGKVKAWNPNTEYQDQAVASSYDQERFTTPIERLFDRLEKRAVAKGLQDIKASKSVLDLPCGTGRHAEALLQRGYNVIGVDISSEMLEVASRKLTAFPGKFETIQHDILEGPLEGLVVDGAICVRVLMHFPFEQQVTFLSNVARSSPRGVVFNQSIISPWHVFRRWIKSLFKTRRVVRHSLTRKSLVDLLEASGLEMIRMRRVLPVGSEAVVVSARPK